MTIEELEKKEEEEFRTGPLSVLTTSVKTNTQVGNKLACEKKDREGRNAHARPYSYTQRILGEEGSDLINLFLFFGGALFRFVS